MQWFLMGMVKHFQSSQNSKFGMPLQYLLMKLIYLKMKLIFCMLIIIKISYKLIVTLWASKFPTKWYYHYWWAWSSILKLLIFCMQINIKVSRSLHYRFWWKKTWPLFMDGVQLSQGYRATTKKQFTFYY